MPRKIYVIGSSYSYASWMQGEIIEDMESCDLVVGCGGSDVSSHYYNSEDSGYLHCDPSTDAYEHHYLTKAIKLNKKIIGICKTGQFLCALAGGKIWQHVKHPFYHSMQTYDNKQLRVVSLHHNLADLTGLENGIDYKLLGWSPPSPCHINGLKQNFKQDKDAEVVYYPKIKALAIQSHPEIEAWKPDKESAAHVTWCRKQLDLLMEDKL